MMEREEEGGFGPAVRVDRQEQRIGLHEWLSVPQDPFHDVNTPKDFVEAAAVLHAPRT